MVEHYDSGPGRKWLFFVAGAGVAGFLGLVRRSDLVLLFCWLSVSAGMLALAFHAQRCRVRAAAGGFDVRLWASNRHVSWREVAAVDVRPHDPVVVLRSGEHLRLLDNWHHDPAAVAQEVRRRWLEATA